jgi:hypothetical protein
VRHPGCAAATVVGLMLLLAFLGMQAPIEAAFFLLVGWALFLGRVLPDLSVSWQGVATACVSLLLFVVGLQWFAMRVSTAHRSGEVASPDRDWKWRWTLMGTAAVMLSFAAGIAVVGATHQLVWMATADKPLAQSSWSGFRWNIESRTDLRQIGIALQGYHEEHAHLPAGGTFDRLGRPLFSWQTALLPFMDQAALFQRINLEVPWDARENIDALSTIVPAYSNERAESEQGFDPSGRAVSHYAANQRVLNSGTGLPLSAFKDGKSVTFVAGEVNANFKPWGHPMNCRDAGLGLNRSPDGFGGPWGGGASLLLADGSVRMVSDGIDQKVLNALATPDGGERVGDF